LRRNRKKRRSNRSERRSSTPRRTTARNGFPKTPLFLKISQNFRKKVRARKKPPLDGRRVERRFRGFLSSERNFKKRSKRFNVGA